MIHQLSLIASTSMSLASWMHYRRSLMYNRSENLRYWLLDMKEDFEWESEHFTQDKNKVAYAMQNLKNESVIKWWWQLIKLCSTDSVITDWNLFRNWLQMFYSIMNLTVSAENVMMQLLYCSEQTMREFINEFEALLNDITWDNEAIATAFRSKLPSWILTQIITDYFLKLSDLYTAYKEAALQAELNIALLDAQKQKVHQKDSLWKKQRTFNTHQVSTVNMTSLRKRLNLLIALRWERLTSEERKWCEWQNLCRYCEKSTHQLQNCLKWLKAENEGLWS